MGTKDAAAALREAMRQTRAVRQQLVRIDDALAAIEGADSWGRFVPVLPAAVWVQVVNQRRARSWSDALQPELERLDALIQELRVAGVVDVPGRPFATLELRERDRSGAVSAIGRWLEGPRASHPEAQPYAKARRHVSALRKRLAAVRAALQRQLRADAEEAPA